MSIERSAIPVPHGGARAVAVIGAGYVGLPTAATLSHFGHHVVCADSDPYRFSLLSRGEIPIVEHGLDDLVHEGMRRGTLRFEQNAVAAVAGAEFVFLCVPTPQGDDGSADLSYVEAVAEEIAAHLMPGAIVVNKSTVPVGTVGLVERVTGRGDVTVVSNPEFLREGTAVRDSLHPDRLVVGAEDQAAAARVGELFAATEAPLIVTDTTTAETIKYASNAFLATKLSFVNAVALLCEAVGADVRDVILGLGYDKRIGFEFLRPGPGWGGSCLPKDTRALVHIADEAGYDFALLRGAITANDEQFERVVAKVEAASGGAAAGAEIAVLGLTFKAGTDDRRNSPALDIARRLVELGASVRAFDPTVEPPADVRGRVGGDDVRGRVGGGGGGAAEAGLGAALATAGTGREADLSGMSVAGDPYEACRDAQVLVVLTEWDEFRWLDFQKIHDLMAKPSVVDARNLLDPSALRRLGFEYTGIGRP